MAVSGIDKAGDECAARLVEGTPMARGLPCWAEHRRNLHRLLLRAPHAKGGRGQELLRGAIGESHRHGFETGLSPILVLWSWVDYSMSLNLSCSSVKSLL